MTVGKLYTLIMIGLVVGGIVVAISLHYTFKREKFRTIQLIQGKIKNGNEDMSFAIPHLKFTNKWEG